MIKLCPDQFGQPTLHALANQPTNKMATWPSQEHRPLKKPRLGNVGPDVYPQDAKQKEVIWVVLFIWS